MPSPVGGVASRVVARRQDGELRLRVFHEEGELVHRVRRIERRGDGARPCDGEERHQKVQPVRQNDGNRPPALYARAREQFRRPFHLLLQIAVSRARAARNQNRVAIRRMPVKNLCQR